MALLGLSQSLGSVAPMSCLGTPTTDFVWQISGVGFDDWYTSAVFSGSENPLVATCLGTFVVTETAPSTYILKSFNFITFPSPQPGSSGNFGQYNSALNATSDTDGLDTYIEMAACNSAPSVGVATLIITWGNALLLDVMGAVNPGQYIGEPWDLEFGGTFEANQAGTRIRYSGIASYYGQVTLIGVS